ncbi:hypothetical protein [Anaerococcus porci]|uniref:DUF1659 domain-containing protein n=1 Tax=Anaerococcus porci TaxID=2652269 RepID=UPI002A749205|nr:hypothetical protein [Anaerococcus porci]MDY3006587.1 hypothetical protein [Anaerococcus porci]
MKIRILFKINDGAEEKKISRTFSNLNEALSNENLKNFAQAYMSLTDITAYTVEKITSEEI